MTRPLLSTGFSIQEIATAKGVSTRTVRRWLTHGLPFVQPVPHGRIFVREQDLEEYLRPRPQQHAEIVMDRMIGEVLTSLQTKPQKSSNSPAVI
jgi:hypothetical protein